MVFTENYNANSLVIMGAVCDTESGTYVINDENVCTESRWVLVKHNDVRDLIDTDTNTRTIILRFVAVPQVGEIRYEMCMTAIITTNPIPISLVDIIYISRIKVRNGRPVSFNCYQDLTTAHRHEIAGYPSIRSKTLGYGDTIPYWLVPIYRSMKNYLIHVEPNC
jgi:hypothetical protein